MSMADLYTKIKQALATKLFSLNHFRSDQAIAQELKSDLVNKVVLVLFYRSTTKGSWSCLEVLWIQIR